MALGRERGRKGGRGVEKVKYGEGGRKGGRGDCGKERGFASNGEILGKK